MTSNGRLRVLSLIVEDRPGVLERVASQVRRRGFNIASLSVGPVAEGRSRMTVTVDAGDAEVDQVAKQVDKLIEVIDVHDLTEQPLVARELVMARISGGAEAVEAARRAGARVVADAGGTAIVEFTAEPSQVETLLSTLRPYGLSELARSGPVAMRRTANT